MERDPVDMIWSNLGTGKRLGQLAEKAFSRRSVTSAAEAGAENKATIAAVNRCATQKQAQRPSFAAACWSRPDPCLLDHSSWGSRRRGKPVSTRHFT
jgi:hypothetical protein